uniref:Uncharacterized protein n=1 Tax=Ananas comosus var. bracteatus TaxID=296719 RepID=A0A6V7Q9N5_ANACO|nr:unnamed protein product [Ananas comosus var. bracteatus]
MAKSRHPQSHSDPAYSTSQIAFFPLNPKPPNVSASLLLSLSVLLLREGKQLRDGSRPHLQLLSTHLRPPRRSSTTITASAAAPKPNPFGIFSTPPKKKKQQGGEEGDANSNPNANPSKNPFSVDFKSLVPVVGSPSTSALFAGGVGRRRKDAQTVFVAGPRGRQALGSPAAFSGAASPCGPACPTSPPRRSSPASPPPTRSALRTPPPPPRTYVGSCPVPYIISPEEAKRLNAVESAFGDPEAIAKAIAPPPRWWSPWAPRRSPLSRRCRRIGGHHRRRPPGGARRRIGGGGPRGGRLRRRDGRSSRGRRVDVQRAGRHHFVLRQPVRAVAAADAGGVPQQGGGDRRELHLIKASLTDDYAAEGSYGLVVSQEGTTPTGTTARYKVSRSQIATLVADVFSNTAVAENKVFWLLDHLPCCSGFYKPSAASKPIDELFGAVPEDGRRRAYREASAKAKAEEEAALSASQKAREAAEAAKKLEKEVKKLSEQGAQSASLAQEARERAEAAGASLENLMDRAKGFGKDFSWEKFSSQLKSSAAQKPEEEKPKAQIATVRGQAKAEKLPPQKAVIRQPTQKQIRQTPVQPDPKPEVKKVFGGLFKQEVIYVDDD